MQVGYVNSSDSSSTTGVSGSTDTTQTNDTPVTSQRWNNWARLVTEYAYFNEPSPPSDVTNASPTFPSNPKPPYDPNSPSDLSSNNGRVAANGLLRFEEFTPGYDPQGEAQIFAQTIGQHKNDPQFLQQYLGTLGSGRVAQFLSYLTSPGAVQTPYTSVNGQTPQQLRQDYQNVASALTTLVSNKDFTSSDMNQLVTQLANTNPQVSYFAKDVLSQASPDVNEMFYKSALSYVLQPNIAGTSQGQSMAAYALQALSQAPNSLLQLEQLPAHDLSTLVSAAMKGEAAYGNPPTIEEFAKTGVFRAQNGQGDSLNGLTNLMFDAAYADVGDEFSAPQLNTSQAQDLQTKLFQAAINTLESDPTVKSFYTQNTSSDGVSMKDALAVEFQNNYDSIVKAYSDPDGEMSSAGLSAFREFFADAVFSPPPSSYALGAVQTIQNRMASYIAQSDKTSSNAQPSQQQYAYAESLGEQAQAMAAGLKESFASILNGSAQADQSTQNLLNGIISIGGAVVGTIGGPAGGIGAAIVGEALSLLVNSSGSSGPSDVQAAVSELKSHGIDVSGYDPGALYDLSTHIANANFRAPFQLGFDTAATVLYNG